MHKQFGEILLGNNRNHQLINELEAKIERKVQTPEQIKTPERSEAFSHLTHSLRHGSLTMNFV